MTTFLQPGVSISKAVYRKWVQKIPKGGMISLDHECSSERQ